MTSFKQWAFIILCIGCGLAVYVGSTLIGALLTGSAVASSAIGALVTFVLVVIWRRWAKVAGTPALGSQGWTGFLPTVVIVMAIAVVMTQILSSFVRLNMGSEGFEQVLVTQASTPIGLLLVSGLVLAPMGEEALLRGFAYPLLRRKWPPLASAFVTSMVFALIHGNLAQIVLAFPLGMLLAYIYEITQRLWVPVTAHMLFNLGSIVLPASLIGKLATPVGAAAAVVALAIAVLLMRETLIRNTSDEGLHGGQPTDSLTPPQ